MCMFLWLCVSACPRVCAPVCPHMCICVVVCMYTRVCVWGKGCSLLRVPENSSVRALSSASISRCMESLVTARTHSSKFVARVSMSPHLEEGPHSAHTPAGGPSSCSPLTRLPWTPALPTPGPTSPPPSQPHAHPAKEAVGNRGRDAEGTAHLVKLVCTCTQSLQCFKSTQV